jgi:UDP-N-acetylmuramoyl-tripeptide--D-alanyl-D-alanine ligase
MRMAKRLEDKITYAANTEDKKARADCMGTAQALRPEIQFHFTYKQEPDSIHMQSCLSGDYNFDNIMAAVVLGKHFGMPNALIQKGIEEYVPQNNRSQVLKKEHNTIYLDAYNANPSSLEAALGNFAAMNIPHKIAVIGDMFEMGSYAELEHTNMIGFCQNLQLEKVWLVGEEFCKQKAEGMLQFKTTADVIAFIKQNPLHEKNIFIKGSRGMKLESLLAFIA